ncbi:MAG: hypothetical protein DRO39_08560 [Thermoprotei archaeon]|nr:MAG: hypothetical protein DRO39_08560 [Thermoprotei archaeon]
MLEPGAVQLPDGSEVPAAMISSPAKTVVVVHPGYRHYYAIMVEGREYREDQLNRVAVMPERGVPYATPVLLRDVVEKIDDIVDW